MNAVGFILTSICSFMVLALSRRWAALGVLSSVCFITQGQILNVGGFHLHAVRLVLLAGFIRIVTRGELRKLEINSLDRGIMAFAFFTLLVQGGRSGVWQEPVGTAYNLLLSYFVFRCLVNGWEEAQVFFLDVALLIIPVAACMLLESRAGKNVFDVMGGHNGTNMRAGRLRCVGAFRGSHTAGIFGATFVPIFAGLYFTHVHRRRTIVAGLIAATVITYTSNSSGPLMAYLSGLVGLAFWLWRKKMRQVRWGIVFSLVALSICMKAPIWYLLAKVSDITGGDGWYRSYLMEQCYKHFSEWWLIGSSDTSGWAVTLMQWGAADLCNMYVSCAANAGIGCLVLFVLILVRGFRNLGLALDVARETLSESEVLLWCLGSALFAHAVTFTSITYWDQMQVAWWAFVAIISGVTSDILQNRPASPELDEVAQAIEPAETAG